MMSHYPLNSGNDESLRHFFGNPPSEENISIVRQLIVLNLDPEPGTFGRFRAFSTHFQAQSTPFPEKFSGKASLKSSIMLKRSIL